MKRKTDNFSKFFNRQRGSAVKEAIKQEKKAEKRDRKRAIEEHFEKKRQAKAARAAQAQAPAGPDKRGRIPGKPGVSSPSANQAPGSHPAGIQDQDTMPLNKYIAHGGICSRRDAADLIRTGKVTVNGKAITEPGTKVLASDTVHANGKKVIISRNFVYILLNKPKDYITTTEDPQGRRTVLDLIRQATTERVYPVGRLDRNTSGVLLLTNDGELAQKLAHPKHEIKKIYHVTLDKALTKADFDKIINGQVVLEDGPAIVDVIAYADARDKTQIGLEIHSGRNRIVRRIFEHLGYDVRGLDRVTYAGLTKKNVPRGKFRLLTEKEIRILKYLNSSFRKDGSGSKAAGQINLSAAPEDSIQPAAGPVRSGSKPPRTFGKPSGKPAHATDKPGKPFRASGNSNTDAPRRAPGARFGKQEEPQRSAGKPPRASGKPARSTGKPSRTPGNSFGKQEAPLRSAGKPSRTPGKPARPSGRSTGAPLSKRPRKS